MKFKNILFNLLILILITMHSFSLNAQTESSYYSIKNRWVLKASYANYTTAFTNSIGDIVSVTDGIYNYNRRKMTNFKVEANYGINKFVEVGVNAGFQHYNWAGEDYFVDLSGELHTAFAPLFGVNLNFHILPFLVSAKECPWDLYLTAKYGGCYLPHRELDITDNIAEKYRQEYGLGIGVGYYIKDMAGFFIEYSVGQFDYFKYGIKEVVDITDPFNAKTIDLSDKPFKFRIGINAKF